MNESVDQFLANAKNWKEEMTLMRKIALDCGLKEDFKWMHPCYDLKGKNILLIHGFKGYVAFLFHKGVLLKDSSRILIQQTENVQSARQIRFTSLQEIIDLEPTIKSYIYEAIEVEKAGLEVILKKTSEFEMPEEFKQTLENVENLKSAFESLTPGRQKGYLLYFSQAKQSKTRISRIEQSIPRIFEGLGRRD